MLKISDRYCERQSSNRALIRDNDRVSIFLKKKKKKLNAITFLTACLFNIHTFLVHNFLTKHFISFFIKILGKNLSKVFENFKVQAWGSIHERYGRNRRGRNLRRKIRETTVTRRRKEEGLEIYGSVRSESKSTRSYSFPCGDNRWPPSSLCCMPADTIRWFGQAERP